MALGRQSTKHVPKTLKAAADLSAAAKQFTFVKVTADQTVNTAGAGERAVGVQQNLPTSGKGCVVALIGGGGSSRLQVGGAVAAGDPLKSDASGRGVTAAGTDLYYAIALEAASNAGERVEAMLQAGRVS
jgi:hypothetical protein